MRFLLHFRSHACVYSWVLGTKKDAYDCYSTNPFLRKEGKKGINLKLESHCRSLNKIFDSIYYISKKGVYFMLPAEGRGAAVYHPR
jgi:hypothetical protein